MLNTNIDHQALIDYFNRQISLEDKEITFLRAHIPLQMIPKGAFLLEEGQVSDAFFFLIKGCIRMFYLVDGTEKTTFFYTENEFVSSYESFTKALPSKHYFQALESSTVAMISKEVAFDLLRLSPKFEFLARAAMEFELSVYQKMIASFITLNASQRYEQLMQEQPGLIQRIPQHYIATYLGVSPETLSRIRKRITTK